ncbi:MAG: M20/M25/M40 family metallo-hydrolase [Anaerolineae bacterium]|nr:M20/M25/M40 family metallo-hydrolase [Phycisphaerae bacterium]
MKILQELCSIPTAPFVESRVYGYVEAFARARRKLKLSRDRFGNRLLVLPGQKKSPRIVFVAHTDHPGFVARRMIDKQTLEADFRGGVLREYVDGSRVKFFDGYREIGGVVIGTSSDRERANFPARATIRVKSAVSKNSPGMFDQGIGRFKGGRFLSRVCDDLAGAAAALTMLDQLHRKSSKPRATVAVLLTRAEEDGFIGALAAAIEPKLLRRDDLMLSIECSAAQPYAPQGKGVIIRVGDRISVFDSSLTFFLSQQAEALAKRAKSFKFQRSLMPGGACEGTVFDAYGFRTAAMCVPLGNYHNMDREKKKIGPEFIDVNDWQNMVKLFVAVAANAHQFDPKMRPLCTRLEKRFRRLRPLLLDHAGS